MRSVFTTSSQLGRQRLHKLWVSTGTLPQVVFATACLRTTLSFVRSLSESVTQPYALLFYVNNGSADVFIHTIHSPNNSYSKGE